MLLMPCHIVHIWRAHTYLFLVDFLLLAVYHGLESSKRNLLWLDYRWSKENSTVYLLEGGSFGRGVASTLAWQSNFHFPNLIGILRWYAWGHNLLAEFVFDVLHLEDCLECLASSILSSLQYLCSRRKCPRYAFFLAYQANWWSILDAYGAREVAFPWYYLLLWEYFLHFQVSRWAAFEWEGWR